MNLSKFLSIAVLLIPIILPAESKKDTTYTFRNTKWGMPMQEVRVSEGKRKPPFVREDDITYVDTISGKEFYVGYYFVDNKLVRAGYDLIETHVNVNIYIEDYQVMKALLIEKYGAPEDEDVAGKNYSEKVWLGDTYKDDPQDWGMAVKMGKLVYQLCFETQKTDIIIKLKGENFEARLLIVYDSKKLADLRKKEVEDKL